MAALGRPVVPDVNAIIATSSAAVSTAEKLRRHRLDPRREILGPGAAVADDRQPGHAGRGQVLGEPVVTQRHRRPGHLADRGQLAGTQQRTSWSRPPPRP